MENFSHSRKPNRGASQATATLYKRTRASNDATNFSGSAMYDDVSGGTSRFGSVVGPTLSPRPEDYVEIFAGFHASRGASIPVLNLPSLNSNDGEMFDVRNPRFNYAEVFGGFSGSEFAASFEELMRPANGGDHHDYDGGSSDEAWMQAETESLSDESEHSGDYRLFTNGDYYAPIGSTMEFNISYHKSNPRSNRDMSTGVTHVAELHADPDYAYIIETPLEKSENKNPPFRMTDDIELQFAGGAVKEKHLWKTESHSSNWDAGDQIFANDSSRRQYQRNDPCSNEKFVTISKINLRTMPSDVPPPSRPPALADVKNGDYLNVHNAASGWRTGDSSPPFFDVEIDASSAAAASAAAIEEAMDTSQAKLKSEKEILGRKREGIEKSAKPGSKSEGKGKKERTSKTINGSSDIKDDKVQCMKVKEDSGMKIHAREEREKAVKTPVPDSLGGEKLFNVPKCFVVEKYGKESQLVQEFDGADEWQEETQFFELVRTDKSKMGSQQTNNEKIFVQSTKLHDLQHKYGKASIAAVEQLESGNKVEPVREDHELEKVQSDMKTAKETKEARKHKGHEKKVKSTQEDNGQSVTARKPLENDKKPTGVDGLGKREKRVNAEEKEKKVEVWQAMEQKEKGQQEKETSKSIENQKRVQGCQERVDEEKSWWEVSKQERNEIKVDQVLVQAEKETMLREAVEQEEKEKRLKEAREREENEKKETEARELEESEKIWRMALEQIEHEKRLKQACLQEENKRRQRKALELEETEKKQREACEKDECKTRPKQVTEQGKYERQRKEVIGKEGTENTLKESCEKEEAMDKWLEVEVCEEKETGKRLEEACEKENIEKMLEEAVEHNDYSKPVNAFQDTEHQVNQKIVEQEGTEELQGIDYVCQQTVRGENGKKQKIAEETHQHEEGEDPVVSEVNKSDYIKNHKENQSVGNTDQNCDELEEIEESGLEDNGKMETEFRDSERKSEAMGQGGVDGNFNVSRMAPCDLEVEVNKFRKDEAGEAVIGIEQRNVGNINNVPKMESNNDKQGLKFAYEWNKRAMNIKDAQVSSSLEENKDTHISTQAMKESVETGRKLEAAKSSKLEGKGRTQSTERKDKNIYERFTPIEKEAERLKRERELESERLRKIEEEREREREREKDRMAVDSIVLEARERGYGEARERAEKAAMERSTAEARQRAMAEARDRLEKACAEAREKSSMEARLRAERAAVERATAEARERAVEKIMSEKAASEARERVERSMSDKFSTSSRNSGMRTSSSSSDLKDRHFQRTSSFGGLRYPYTSAYSGVEGESAQRCKARLERYQRTAERAAKALEEKNKRDLVAQREQAERSRLAETLDADVKRWSSGKENNLRALLSTLQYILGPESGWQPIPLTEVITSAAVKKAYRKATLCVHPDKLQQRSATIHQKYVCEKVFDLLKEAWTKFNSEER